MPNKFTYDAVIVGSGPNGLAAAIRLAQNNLSVLVLEAKDTIGGGCRSAELTLPGYVHDVCSAIHPLGMASPFFSTLPLARYGLSWIQPDFPLAHPLDDGAAALLHRDVSETARGLGADQAAYSHLITPFVNGWHTLLPELLQPVLHLPKHPLQLLRFGWVASGSATALASKRFQEPAARALFAGLAAHSFLRLDQRPSAAFGLILGLLAHAVGWPFPRGGSQHLADALAAHLRTLGGEIRPNSPVTNVDELPLSRALLLDVTPKQLLAIAGHKFPDSYRSRLERYRYGPGVFKLDYALHAPIPWTNELTRRAGTVHVGGTFKEVIDSEAAVTRGEHPEKPFILLAQPTVFDPSRAPAGKHIAWAYCHVPNASTFDMTERVEKQIERFAPGFRECIAARRVMRCAEMEWHNPNLVGGDINGGLADIRQLLARPALSTRPYRTPVPGIYLCSSSTPPGGGVHGMCGFHAAETALGDCF